MHHYAYSRRIWTPIKYMVAWDQSLVVTYFYGKGGVMEAGVAL